MDKPTKSTSTLLLLEKQGKFDRIAHELATDYATGAIESYCHGRPTIGPQWFDIKPITHPGEKADAAKAIEYLGWRGMLERNLNNNNLVRVRRLNTRSSKEP